MIDSEISYDSSGKLQSVTRSSAQEVTTLHLRIISGVDLPKPRGAGSKVIEFKSKIFYLKSFITYTLYVRKFTKNIPINIRITFRVP